MNKTKTKIRIFLSWTLVLVALVTCVAGISKSQNTSACDTEECINAAAEASSAAANAAAAGEQASLYEAKVDELNQQITDQISIIASTTSEIESLEKEIEEDEAKLSADQDALAQLLVNMHFEGDSEPITILAGSTSISDLAEKQARNEAAKAQIADVAEEVRQKKEELEQKKQDLEDELARQEQARNDLEVSRTEQAELVAKYRDNQEAYEAEARAAQEAYNAAYAEWLSTQQSYISSNAYYGSTNSYPWQESCPSQADSFGTYWNGTYIGGYVCECVSYVGWKALEKYGLYLAWGNAYSWDDRARALGYTVDHSPEAGSIGQIDGGQYGHVFWVESVNDDGSINITEYNNAYSTGLFFGSSHTHDFGAQTISAAGAARYNYIHLR